MKNYIMYENGYAKVFYKNLDDELAENIKKTLTNNQTFEETTLNSLPSDKLLPPSEEQIVEDLRQQRQIECFSIINQNFIINGKSITWFDTLTQEQKIDAERWLQDWRDVTETKFIPEKPSWLK